MAALFQDVPRFAEHFAQIRRIEELRPRFEKSRFLFCLFRSSPTKSQTSFDNRFAIRSSEYGLRFPVRSSEDRPELRPRNAQFMLKSTPARLHISPKSHHITGSVLKICRTLGTMPENAEGLTKINFLGKATVFKRQWASRSAPKTTHHFQHSRVENL